MHLTNIIIFIILLLLFLFILHSKNRQRIIKKISSMPMEEKYSKINALAEPLGYTYNNCQDVFVSTLDAWQKEFGYTTLYDRMAPRFNMVLDCEPVYFYFDDKTWLIEFWKGQYGINVGGEIGIYYVDEIVPKNKLHKTLFQAVSADEMLPLSITLNDGTTPLIRLSQRHWWLTGFRMGLFANPSRIIMNISIIFPERDMLNAFVNAMLALGYKTSDLSLYGLQVFFTFATPYTEIKSYCRPLVKFFSQLENKFFCWLYLMITNAFCLTIDRLLYLYYYLPFAFRHMLCLRRYKKIKRRK